MIAEAGLDHFALAKSGRESRLPLLFAKVSKNGPQKKKKKKQPKMISTLQSSFEEF